MIHMEDQFIKSSGDSAAEIKKAIKDCWRRLLQPGMESEFRMALKTKADEEAITVFAENLRQLLLSSPLGSKRILAIDPGYAPVAKLFVWMNRAICKKQILFLFMKLEG